MGSVDWCDKAMVRRATGGMLTVLAESGSGTLAGSAHMEAFRQLAANDAASIAECINRQYTRRVLNAAFPGQPALVRFELIPPVTDDRAAQAQILATLASAGFKPAAEDVSEMMGFEVAAAPQQQPDVGSRMFDVGFNGSAAAPQVVTNSQAETPAPLAPSSQIQNPTSNIQNASELSPLSDSELSALQSLASGGLSADALQGTSLALADALQGAISNASVSACHGVASEQDETRSREPGPQIQNPTSYIQNSCNQYEHDRDCEQGGSSAADDADKEPWQVRQDERERLESLRSELERLEEGARDAEAAGDPSLFDEAAARDRILDIAHQGDPLSIDDIEKRLAELDAEDAAEDEVVENSRDYKRDSHGRFASTGANLHKQKGGRTTKGNPKAATTKSNTPLKAAPGAKPQAQVDATEHALKATAKKGKVQIVTQPGKKPIHIESGHKDYHGTKHAARHFKPGDTDARKTAKAIVLGEKSKDDDSIRSQRKNYKAMLADKGSHIRLITSYKEKKPKP